MGPGFSRFSGFFNRHTGYQASRAPTWTYVPSSWTYLQGNLYHYVGHITESCAVLLELPCCLDLYCLFAVFCNPPPPSGTRALLSLFNNNSDAGKVFAAHAIAKIAIKMNPALAFSGQKYVNCSVQF